MTHQEAVDTLATERYLLGEMSDTDREAFEDHYFGCEACAADVKAATAMAEGVKSEGARGAASVTSAGNVSTFAGKKPTAKTPGRWSVALPWAVAASLTFVVAYQSVWVVPGLRSELEPRIVAPMTLRPASRGEEPVVRLTPQSSAVLPFEVPSSSGAGELAFDISTVDGRRVYSSHTPAPAGGAPLVLVIPSWTSLAPMRYILSVRDMTTGLPVGEYRFVVSQ